MKNIIYFSITLLLIIFSNPAFTNEGKGLAEEELSPFAIFSSHRFKEIHKLHIYILPFYDLITGNKIESINNVTQNKIIILLDDYFPKNGNIIISPKKTKRLANEYINITSAVIFIETYLTETENKNYSVKHRLSLQRLSKFPWQGKNDQVLSWVTVLDSNNSYVIENISEEPLQMILVQQIQFFIDKYNLLPSN